MFRLSLHYYKQEM